MDLNEKYTLDEINQYLDELIRTNLRNVKSSNILKKINKWLRDYMFIYKITNVKNDKFYIGSTCEIYPTRRLSRHHRELKQNEHGNVHLQRAFNKYGDVFHYEIIELFPKLESYQESKNKIEHIEQQYIERTKCYQFDIGYNESRKVHGGFNFCTWEDMEQRTGVKPEVLQLVFDLLINTDLPFLQIDEQVYKETGFNKKLAYKVYNKASFRGLSEGLQFRPREARDSIRGELSHNSKLTNDKAKEIIDILLNHPEVPIPRIAEHFGVSRAAIWDIYKKRTWKHLTKDIVFLDRPERLKTIKN